MSRRDPLSSGFHSQNPQTEAASGGSCTKTEATGQEKVFHLRGIAMLMAANANKEKINQIKG